AVSEPNEEGEVKVFFELNGQPRIIRIQDRGLSSQVVQHPKAEENNSKHIGAPMPGVVASIAISENTEVHEGDLLLTIEAMKMETSIHAESDAVVKSIYAKVGGQIDAKDLLIEMD
ncbi:MAG: biotin/lipoyl-binding protein, partial [Desulfobacterales bacterium]|nr:biotin/lipoyl-binding protein [Desulfobacterales bacterium]